MSTADKTQQRLQKYIAASTAYSRRRAEELIRAGQVKVNNQTIQKLGTVIKPDKDQVKVAGQLITQPQTFQYVAINKPAGFVCTRARFKTEKSIYQLVPAYRNLVIAGRLDKNSQGLVILTDDGELVQQLTHPRFRHQKEYLIELKEPINQTDLNKLTRGVRLEEGLARADKISRDKPTVIRMTLHQGWKRQIRRMLEKIDHQVQSLIRIRLGRYQLGNLPSGKSKIIKKNEIL